MKFTYYIIAFIFIILSCRQDEEGCLDLAANNLDITTDIDCENCCVYPDISLLLFHFYDTLDSIAFSKDSIYSNEFTDSLKISSWSFYFSDLHVEDVSGNIHQVVDSISLPFSSDTFLLADDFILSTESSSRATFGEYRSVATIREIRFKVGLSSSILNQEPLEFSNSHALNFSTALLSDDSTYIAQRFSVISGDKLSDTIAIPITMGVNVALATDFIITPGSETTFNLGIDYKTIISGVDFNGDIEDIENGLIDNMAVAFKLLD